MIEPFLLLGTCLLLGLLCLGVAIWVAVTGRFAYLDGLSLALISLAVGAIFLSVVGWSYRTGELTEILKSLRGGKTEDLSGDPTQQNA